MMRALDLRRPLAFDEAAPRDTRWTMFEKRVRAAWSKRDGWHVEIRTVRFPGEHEPRRVRIYATPGGGRIETEREAQKVRYRIISELVDGRRIEDVLADYQQRRIPGNLVAARWEEFCADKDREVRTGRLDPLRVVELRAYLRRRYLDCWQHTDVHEIDRQALVALIRFLRERPARGERPLSEKTIKNILGDVAHFLRWLAESRVLLQVPPIPYKVLRLERYQPTVPDRSTVEAVLAAIPVESRGLWLIRSFLGLRPSEARRLDVGDLRDGRTSILVPALKSKTRKARLLELPRPLLDWFRAPEVVELHGELEQRFGNEPLFLNPNTRGRWTETPERRVIERAFKVVGVVGIRPNEMGRHWCFTELVNSGESIYAVRELAGHGDVTTTQRYLALRPQTVARAIHRLESGRRVDGGPKEAQ